MPDQRDQPLLRRMPMRHNLSQMALLVGGCLGITIAPTIATPTIAQTYYVSGNGNDNNSGLNPTQAFKTLQKAADLTQPGTTVLVMNGTYQNDDPNSSVLSINHSGTANAWIHYKAAPGHRPKIKVRNWTGIAVNGAAYITIAGFTLEGNRDELDQDFDYVWAQRNNLNNPITSGNCIGVTPLYQSNPEQRSHHIIIRQNTVSKCPGGGIYTTRADYIRVEDNIIWGNAYYSPYGNSGLSFYQNWNSDRRTQPKFFALRNTIYDNQNRIPNFYSNADPDRRTITDGNGIIVDDSRNTQNHAGSTGESYQGQTYIAHNLVYKNSGRGIHVFSSDNVTIEHNRTYHNSAEPATPEGELTAICASNIHIAHNSVNPLPDRSARTAINPPDCQPGNPPP
jgi:hypothetical protein